MYICRCGFHCVYQSAVLVHADMCLISKMPCARLPLRSFIFFDYNARIIYTASDRNCRFDEYLYYNERDNSAAKLFFEEYQQSISI